MEPENPDDRPESPKKKIRPSSTTNSEVSHSDSKSATGSVDSSDLHSGMNGCGGIAAPKRDGRLAEEASSSSETNTSNGPSRTVLSSIQAATPKAADSIQEEEVSSSENTVRVAKPPTYSEGNADSLSEVLSRASEQMPHGSEAERKEL